MKNIFFAAVASIGLHTIAQAQSPKTIFQYEQEIANVLKTAVENNAAEKNALPMPEGDNCYAFESKIHGIDRQVFYCEDTKKRLVCRGEKPKDVDLEERQGLLDAITNKYPKN